MRVAGVVAAAALLLALLGAGSAAAAELVYWENDPLQGEVAVLVVGNGFASPVNVSGAGLDAPEGMSYDPVANRLYVAAEGVVADGHIAYLDLDGSGGGELPLAPGTPAIKDPRGVVVDPAARIAYWLNNTDSSPETISWQRLDGSEGGDLDLGGQPLLGTERLTADPAAGRLYWGNDDGSIHYAPLVGSGGMAGELGAKAGGAGAALVGLDVDSAAGRVFWLESEISAVYADGIGGGAKEAVGTGTAPVRQPVGLAFDPERARLYWANSENEGTDMGAIGFSDLGSGGGGITPFGVTSNHPQDLVVIKSPTATAAPQVTLAGTRLQCSQGSWAPDHAATFVYQSPRSFAYRWTINGATVAGATEPSLAPRLSGSYSCAVIAANQGGSTTQPSPGVAVRITSASRTKAPPSVTPAAAKLRLLGKARRLKGRPGKAFALKVRASNQGGVAAAPAKVCLKLAKKAKRALRPGRCRSLGPVAPGATATARLRLHIKRSARPGVYELRIVLPGSPVKVTLRVVP